MLSLVVTYAYNKHHVQYLKIWHFTFCHISYVCFGHSWSAIMRAIDQIIKTMKIWQKVELSTYIRAFDFLVGINFSTYIVYKIDNVIWLSCISVWNHPATFSIPSILFNLFLTSMSLACHKKNYFWYVTNSRISKYYITIILIFFNVQNWDSQPGQKQLLENENNIT